jgi:hypothetical protein
MADTRQIVAWALEKTCNLRNDGQKSAPMKALTAVARARAYSKALRDNERGFQIIDDVYVTGHTFGGGDIRKKLNSTPFPYSGFIISKEFESAGGPAGLFAMCGSCEANITRNDLAGCCGSLFQYPNSPETDSQIRAILDRFGLNDELKEAFPETNPIWYGLWAVSPVPPRSLLLLRTIISEMRIEDSRELEIPQKKDDRLLRDFALFTRAIDVAEQHNIPLHVELVPLGHTDFGFYTVFPHCPFCKAATRTKLWQRKYPTALCKCHVCSREYSPAETANSEGMPDEREDLRDLLGPAAFAEFAKKYLMAHGQTEQDASMIIEEMEAREAAHQERLREFRRLKTLSDTYLNQHVLSGLTTMPPPASENRGVTSDNIQNAWFEAEVFEEVLHRCQAHNIAILTMRHDSPDGKNDREQSEFKGIKNPIKLLRKWRAQECNGKFHATFNVPDKLIQNTNPN